MTYQTEWLQLSLFCDPKQAESLGALLVEAGALGVQEQQLSEEPRTQLIAYFSHDTDTSTQAHASKLARQFGAKQEELIWSRLRDDGWATRWQAFFQPLPIGEKLLICPTWETPPEHTDRTIIWLDPGMAFGTGHHATTRSCLLFLETLIQPGQRLLDVGCGSGILSIAALHLGASHAVGLDLDPDAVQIAKENAEQNHLSDRCTFSTTPLEALSESFPLVVANLQAHILLPLVQPLLKSLAPGGSLLLSGIWRDFENDVTTAYQDAGCQLIQAHQEDGWTTLHFQR